ncbi:MAG TPA: PAS domain S-box protein [Verrucomicrobiae bacterium]|nr:PAS domain S-box protein [Verrucomicrobiae bacterium]
MLTRKQVLAPRSAWGRYSVGSGCVVLGWLAREALTPAVGPTALPFIFFFPAVAMAAWVGGLGPGILALVLSAVAANWFFVAPTRDWALHTPGDLATMGSFAFSCSFILSAIDAMHRARARILAEVRKREAAELETHQQKELLATTLASIGDAVISTDTAGHIVFLNAEAAALTGWKNSEAEKRPLSEVFHIINEKTRQPVESPVEKVLQSGTVMGLANHTLLIAKDGREIPIDDSAAPIRQPDGPLFGVVLVFRDVTAQRKSQEIAARLAAIVEHSGDVILTKDLNGIIRSWNASAERLFGYRAEEIIGKPITVLFPPDRLEEENHILGSLRRGKPVERFQTIRVTKSGRQVPVAVSISPLKDQEGELIGASKVVHDITELVAAREALTREKELLATTLASIGDAVVVTDAEGCVTFLNGEAERLTKWTSTEALGKPLPEIFRIINEETRRPVENPVEKVLRIGGVVGLANHTILRAKDGTQTPIDDSAAPIRHANGQLLGVVLVFRDFTERRQAEKELREAHGQLADRAGHLEKLVRERTARLQDVVNELQHVSYAMAHDMRAPLRAMSTFASLLAEESPNGIAPSRAQEYTRRIIVAAKRLDKLIQDALNYTKVAQQEIQLGPVDLSKLVRDLIDTYPNFHSDKADIHIANELPVVLGNDSLLTQCFSNLIGNAVKFVAPGVKPRVRLSAETSDGTARISIQDNGIGIPKGAQARLFQMFQKLNAGYEGTGIGLAIVRKVVERMRGKVGVESEPEAGSTFWVELSLADGPKTTKWVNR